MRTILTGNDQATMRRATRARLRTFVVVPVTVIVPASHRSAP